MLGSNFLLGGIVGGMFVATIYSDTARSVAKQAISAVGKEAQKQIEAISGKEKKDDGK